MDDVELVFSDFAFTFDERLLASAHRELDEVRLAVVRAGSAEVAFTRFVDIVDYIPAEACTIWNDTIAQPSLLAGTHQSGTDLSICFLQEVPQRDGQWEAIILASSDPPPVGPFSLAGSTISGTILRKTNDFDASYWIDRSRYQGYRAVVAIDQSRALLLAVLERRGRYIHPWYTNLNELSPSLLNPISAVKPGSICPSLPARRFTPSLLAKLDDKGIARTNVSLGMNFSWNPSSDDTRLADYSMNEEQYQVLLRDATVLNRGVEFNREIVAIGTSAVRAVETVGYPLTRSSGRTSLFIKPGFKFQVVTGLLTNLHVPGSTHVIMAAAIGGRRLILETLAEAASRGFRFGIHGDALLILSGGRTLGAAPADERWSHGAR